MVAAKKPQTIIQVSCIDHATINYSVIQLQFANVIELIGPFIREKIRRV